MASLPRAGVDSSVKSALIESALAGQTKSGAAYSREPLLAEIPDQGFVLATVGGTLYIYARMGINRYKVAMTAV